MTTADDGPLGDTPPSLPPPPRKGLSVADYIERQFEDMAGGPTMAELLRAMDERGRPTGITGEMILTALHEGRQEREEQLSEIWKR